MESSSALTSWVIASFSGVGTPSSRPKRPMPPFKNSISVCARLDVLEHARLVVVGDVGLRGVVDELLGIGVEDDPCAPATAFPSSTSALTIARRSGRSHAAVREPGERADGVRRGVEDDLAPLRRPGVRDRRVGMPPRVHASASARSRPHARAGSNGPSVVSPFTSHCTTPGSRIFPAGNVVPRMTRPTCASRPPRCRRRSAPSPRPRPRTRRRRRDRAFRVHRLRRDDPEVARRSSLASVVAVGRPRTSPTPTSRSPFALIASTCACETS